jgi:hypothetical protein
MKKFIVYLLIVLGLNVLSFFVFAIPMYFSKNQNTETGSFIFALVLFAISLFIQFIVAFILINGQKKKELGKAMLLAVGIIFLVGLSFCSGLW